MNYLYINNQYITTLQGLKECFLQEETRSYNSSLFNELKEYYRSGEIKDFLCDIGEEKLVEKLGDNMYSESDSEMMRSLIVAITGKDVVIDFDYNEYIEIVKKDIKDNKALFVIRILKQVNEQMEFLIIQDGGLEHRESLHLKNLPIGIEKTISLEIDVDGGEVVFIINGLEIDKKKPIRRDSLSIQATTAIVPFTTSLGVSTPSYESSSSAYSVNTVRMYGGMQGAVRGLVKHVKNQMMEAYDAANSIMNNDSLNSGNDSIEFKYEGIRFVMKYVAGGAFWMGAQRGNVSGRNYDYNASNSESKVHEVSLRSYYISETVVTQALWKAVMGRAPHLWGVERWTDELSCGDDYPAYYVSWDDCQLFIKALNEGLGSTFRLPTEAEWEYAARGGRQNAGAFFAGTVWCSENGAQKVHVVKVKKPNPLGVFDMSGNVWEWCQDWYGRYHRDKQNNPTGPSTGSERVLRGGSFFSTRSDCRVSSRNHMKPSDSGCDIGFRLCLPT
jgi:formylglycine-generating enzyme required for sulfatase activity